MSLHKELIEKFENKTAVIGVLGLGYVGLPLAVEKAKAGYKVIGFDVQDEKVQKVNNGNNYIGDVIPEDLKELSESKKLTATNNFNEISKVDAIAICVPTPLDIYKQPNMDYVKTSAESVAENMSDGTLVVLESTTYPGTTEEIIKTALETKGYVVGKDAFVAYSPERVDPGNKQFKTKNTPKVVGGITDNCTVVAATMYRNVLDGDVHEVSSPAVAEMEKLLENTFRNINIALANEMAVLCDKMNMDVWEVIDAAATKPYGFMPFYPGPGLGGHCIPIDPWYLTYKAREYNYHTKLIEIAGEINDEMPMYVVNKLIGILNNEYKPMRGSNILILGISYKKDIDDLRHSPILDIIKLIESFGAIYEVVDPNFKTFNLDSKKLVVQEESSIHIEDFDAVLLGTNHTNIDYEFLKKSNIPILDTRNHLNNKDYKNLFTI